MVADTTPEPVTLGDILSAVARRASDGQLLAMTVVGLFGAAVIARLLEHGAWIGAAGSLAIGAYGGWGIADRELNALWSRPGASRAAGVALQFARGLAATVAALATLAVLATLLVPVLGRWVS